MAKPGPGGTIYFIAELGFDGRPSGMVKIGIVKDSDRSRTVEQRCDEHQTGNPNQLEVIHTVLSPMVERIETLLHGELATARVGGEWFHLPSTALQSAIQTAEQHAAEAHNTIATFERAHELANVISNGKEVVPTTRQADLGHHLASARAALKVVTTASSRLVDHLAAAQDAQHPEVPWIETVVKNGKSNFDAKAFQASHPRLYTRCLQHRIERQRTFRLSVPKPTPEEIAHNWPEQIAIASSAEKLDAAHDGGDRLHNAFLALTSSEATLKWKVEQLDVQLRVECDLNDGIQGVCKWSRQDIERTVLDVEALRQTHPTTYAKFVNAGDQISETRPRRDYGRRDTNLGARMEGLK